MSDFGGATDWFNEITRQTISQVHTLSFSGGIKNTTYYAALNYRNLQGLVKDSYNEKVNGRMSLSQSALQNKLKIDMTLANTVGKFRPTDYEVYRQAMEANPTLPVYNEDGTFAQNMN